MAFEIEWTKLARTQTGKIYEYLISVTSIKAANRQINRIVSHIDILKNYPRLGQREEQLKHYAEEFRYLVTGHYKIIYRIGDNKVTISSVFDCRQDPENLKEMF